jgi:hypothetical protein
VINLSLEPWALSLIIPSFQQSSSPVFHCFNRPFFHYSIIPSFQDGGLAPYGLSEPIQPIKPIEPTERTEGARPMLSALPSPGS